MRLAQIHKKLGMQALDPSNQDAERIAESFGFNRNGKFVSFKEEYQRMMPKVEYKKAKKKSKKK